MNIKLILKHSFRRLCTYLRVTKYNLLSDAKCVGFAPRKVQPLQTVGRGLITFGKNVTFGYYPCSSFWSTYAYLEVRNPTSRITIEDDVIFNNGISIICDGAEITIGARTLIGLNCQIYDADFHGIDPEKRRTNEYEKRNVTIGENVWLGNNVIILKGVSIGKNSIIAAGAIVLSDIPECCVAGGVPAKVLKQIVCEAE